jgi:hypothetical protein
MRLFTIYIGARQPLLLACSTRGYARAAGLTIETQRSAYVSSGQDFGANDWLVEEMYERYQADRSSVPAEWVTYFQNNPQGGSVATPTTPRPTG